MKFYKRFPGDITIKTGDLTLREFGAYDRLLDHFYAKEEPIRPERVYSVCRALDKADRDAVDRVLAEFFVLTEAGWVQGRAEEEIESARPRIETARANGKKGGRPKTPKPNGTNSKPNGFSNGTETGTESTTGPEPNGKTSQIPDTYVEPNGSTSVGAAKPHRPTRKPPRGFAVTDEMRRWAAETVPLAAVDAETERFRDYTFANAISDWPGAWRNWLRKAQDFAAARSRPAAGNRQEAIESRNRAVGQEWARQMRAEISEAEHAGNDRS